MNNTNKTIVKLNSENIDNYFKDILKQGENRANNLNNENLSKVLNNFFEDPNPKFCELDIEVYEKELNNLFLKEKNRHSIEKQDDLSSEIKDLVYLESKMQSSKFYFFESLYMDLNNKWANLCILYKNLDKNADISREDMSESLKAMMDNKQYLENKHSEEIEETKNSIKPVKISNTYVSYLDACEEHLHIYPFNITSLQNVMDNYKKAHKAYQIIHNIKKQWKKLNSYQQNIIAAETMIQLNDTYFNYGDEKKIIHYVSDKTLELVKAPEQIQGKSL